jgi:hypothetical protein
MIYCFRSFHTEKNVISVSHEKNGNLSGLKLINGGEVKKSFAPCFLFLRIQNSFSLHVNLNSLVLVSLPLCECFEENFFFIFPLDAFLYLHKLLFV